MTFDFIKKYKNYILTIIAVLLGTGIIFSVINQNTNDKRKKISTALLNPKNIEKVEKFELTGAEGKITLEKNSNFWIIQTDTNEYELPANSSFINAFKTELSKIISLYKITELSKNNYEDLFPENISFLVKYYISETESTTLYFGKYDFSQNFRYLMTDKNTTVYEISTSFDKYLNSSLSVWAESSLISQNISGSIKTSDIQRIIYIDNSQKTSNIISSESNPENFEQIKYQLLELRHGGKCSKNINFSEKPETRIIIELGNKQEINMSFYPVIKTDSDQDDIYLAKITYTDGLIFNYKISSWTYNKIKEMML